MHFNKTTVIGNAIIGAVVAVSYFYTRNLERSVERMSAKIEADRQKFNEDIANLGK
jgi:mannose/fructose/N-acetylgalactosamine-specific phosphotransferase system component IIC